MKKRTRRSDGASRPHRRARTAAEAQGRSLGSPPEPAVPRRGAFGWRSLLPLIVVAAGIAAHINGFSGTFVFDDDRQILENRRILTVFPLGETLGGRRPVVDLTLAMNMEAGLEGRHVDVFGFHLVNLATHLLAALVLFGVVRRTAALALPADRSGARARWLALVIALLWVVHPLQTQAVTYLIQRAESMMGLFYLLTVYAFLRGVKSTRPTTWHVIAVGACALGMGCKAVMVTAPLTVFLFDWVLVTRSFQETLRRRWPLYAGLAATWIILYFCDVVGPVLAPAPDSRPTVGFGYRGVTPLAYALTQAGVLVHYVRLSLWPHPLCLDYEWPIVQAFGNAAGAVLAVVVLLAGTLWACRRGSWLGLVGVWFFLVLAPTSSIIPIKDAAFEHRMYLPLAAVLAAAVVAMDTLLHRVVPGTPAGGHRRRVVSVVLVAAAGVALTGGTISRNRAYANDLTMWQDVLAKRPEHARAHMGLGRELYHARQYADAEAAFQRAIELGSTDPGAYHNLGEAREKLGKLEEAEEAHRIAIRLNPRSAKVHYSLGNTLRKLDRRDEAEEEYLEALRLDPRHVSAHVNVATLLREQGRLEEAIEHYQRALAVQPTHANAHYNLGAVLSQMQRTEEAITELERALTYNPNHGLARDLLDRIRQRLEEADSSLIPPPGDTP